MNLRVGRTQKLTVILAGLLFTAAPGFSGPATSVVTVQIVGGGTVKPNYDGQALTNGNKYSMTAKPRAGFKFTGWSGSLTSTKPKLTFTNEPDQEFTATFVDKQKPTLKIGAVPGRTALTNDSFYVSGTARDNDALAGIFCRVNGSGWEEASSLNGGSNWWFTVSLDAGENLLEAYAVDATENYSKTNKLKLIYSVAPTTLAGYTLSYVTTNGSPETFNFGTSGFTGTNGVGTYTYKKLNPVSGRVALAYTAPPSATGRANNVTVQLQFTGPTDGFFNDSEGEHTFSLSPANDLAPGGFTDSTISLFYADDEIGRTDLGFPNPPLIATNDSTVLANPMLVPLDGDYPGQYGDRVNVPFSRQHYVSQVDTWVESTPVFIGTVIEIADQAVFVLFDSPPKGDKANIYALLDGEPLDILTCTYDTYESGVLVANDTATFSYTNTSPDGALLQLNQGGTSQYLVMNFIGDSESGSFYEEDYSAPGVPPVVRSGMFSIALAPQIATSPASVAVTNGGTASFSVKATGTPTLSFQWQLNGTNLTDGATGSGSTITGSATTNLIVSVVSTNDVGSYRVVVTNSLGTATSAAATLTIAAPPQITSQPVNSFPTNGGTSTFSVTATGSLPLAYRWQVNGTNLNNGITAWNSVIAGALTNNLTISTVTTNDIGYYQVIVTNSFGSVTSTPPALLNLSN